MPRKIALWIFVGLISIGQLQRIELTQINLSIYLHDIFILFWIFHTLFTTPLTFLYYIYNYLKNNKKILLFSILGVISLILNIILLRDYISILYFLRLMTYIIFGFTLIFQIKNKKIEAEYLKFQIFSIGLFSLFLGFIQYILIKDTRFLAILGWDDHYARMISTYFDPGFTGIIFVLTLFIGLTSKYLQNNIIKTIFFFLFILGIILTFSRASYLALIIGLLFLLVTKNKISKINIKLIFLSLALIPLLIILVPKPLGEGIDLLRTASINARIKSLKQQIATIDTKTFIIGNGPYSVKNSLYYGKLINNNLMPSHSRLPDNIFINILLSTGVFGLILFILIIKDWLIQLKNLDSSLFAAFTALLIHTQFNSSLIQPFVLLVFLGSVASIIKLKSK